MNRQILKTGLAFICAMMVISTYGQDIHFSQFGASPLNLNPSLTGFFDGDYRFIGNHRRQWKSVTVPYTTFSGSFDMPLSGLPGEKNRYGAGLLINHDKAGDSKLGILQAALSFSLIRPVGNDSTHFVGIGLQGGYVQRSINYNELYFDEQYDGDVFNPSIPNTEDFSTESFGYADIGAGLSWLYRKSEKFKTGAGVSLQHINRPKDSFMDNSIKVFSRLQVNAMADFAVSDKIDLLPAVLFMRQGSFTSLSGGTSARYRVSEKPGKHYSFLIGGWLRKSDAFFLSAGMEYNNLTAGFSYDFNTSQLDRASDGKGGYELSLVYIIRRVKPVGIIPPCPLY